MDEGKLRNACAIRQFIDNKGEAQEHILDNPAERVTVIYSDAAFEPDKPAGIAYVISSPRRARPLAGRLELPTEELAIFVRAEGPDKPNREFLGAACALEEPRAHAWFRCAAFYK